MGVNDATTQTDEAVERPAGHRSKAIIAVCGLAVLVLLGLLVAINQKNQELTQKEITQTETGAVETSQEGQAALNETRHGGSLVHLIKDRVPTGLIEDVETTDPELFSGEGDSAQDQYDFADSLQQSMSFEDQLKQQELQLKQERYQWEMSALRDDIGMNVSGAAMPRFEGNASAVQSGRSIPLNGGGGSSTQDRINALKKRIAAVKERQQDLLQGNQVSATQPVFAPSGLSVTPQESIISGSSKVRVDVSKGRSEILPGTLIDAVLNQRVSTDHPSDCIGLVRHNVYDLEYENVLIPQGSKVICSVKRVSGANQPIQSRVAIGVKRIVRPDGVSIIFTDLKALNHDGTGGVAGDVNLHLFAQTMGTFAYALIGHAPSIAYNGDTDDTGDNATASVLEGLKNQTQPLANKYLSIVPTIDLKRGTPFKIVLDVPVPVKPYKALAEYQFGNL